MKLRCVLVDDEPPAIDELAYILSGIRGVEVVGTAPSVTKAIAVIDARKPDLVFLDIQMPGRDGFDVIAHFKGADDAPLFVFVTAYDQHAVKAFDAQAIDYVLKPFSRARVRQSIERARRLIGKSDQPPLDQLIEKVVAKVRPHREALSKIAVEHRGRIRLLDPEGVVFCQAANKGIRVHVRDADYELNGLASLDELDAKLKAYVFFRVHRSYLVNLAWVKEVIPWFNGRYLVTLNDDAVTEVPVSRARVREFKARLGLT